MKIKNMNNIVFYIVFTLLQCFELNSDLKAIGAKKKCKTAELKMIKQLL